jgi:hypothetical protein
MKNIIFSVSIVFIAIFFVVMHITAADNDSVTATVTAQNISVTVTDGSVSYGTVSTSSHADTTSAGVNDSQTATNNGNVTEDFSIQGVDSAAWELAAAAGSETYAHGVCTSDCDGSPTWTQFNEDSYTSFAADVAASGGTQVFDLRLSTPASTATYTPQTVDVTILATAS